MKFHWPLQRLLDVTEKRELACKAELFDLSRQIADRQQETVRRRKLMRRLLCDLGQLEVGERISRHAVLMRSFAAEERALALIVKKIESLERQREEKKQELTRIMGKRDALGKLRQEARLKYERYVDRREQQQAEEMHQIRLMHRDQQPKLRSA
jgi:hypothetical protein